MLSRPPERRATAFLFMKEIHPGERLMIVGRRDQVKMPFLLTPLPVPL